MRVERVRWEAGREAHLARHGVTCAEAEVLYAKSLRAFRSRGGSVLVLGQSDAGRYLAVVVRSRGHGTVAVVTARDMTDAERRRYRS